MHGLFPNSPDGQYPEQQQDRPRRLKPYRLLTYLLHFICLLENLSAIQQLMTERDVPALLCIGTLDIYVVTAVLRDYFTAWPEEQYQSRLLMLRSMLSGFLFLEVGYIEISIKAFATWFYVIESLVFMFLLLGLASLWLELFIAWMQRQLELFAAWMQRQLDRNPGELTHVIGTIGILGGLTWGILSVVGGPQPQTTISIGVIILGAIGLLTVLWLDQLL